MSKLTARFIGKQHFGNTIDITDPCYDRDVWCRLNDIEISDGEYDCVAWIDPNTKRVAICGIYKGAIPNVNQMTEIGEVGVDAGLCGFFNHKKDYADDEWSAFCREIGFEKQAWIKDDGFFTSSGYGDGCYGVYAKKGADGKYASLEIRFI